jgi:hypothetical protein
MASEAVESRSSWGGGHCARTIPNVNGGDRALAGRSLIRGTQKCGPRYLISCSTSLMMSLMPSWHDVQSLGARLLPDVS